MRSLRRLVVNALVPLWLAGVVAAGARAGAGGARRLGGHRRSRSSRGASGRASSSRRRRARRLAGRRRPPAGGASGAAAAARDGRGAAAGRRGGGAALEARRRRGRRASSSPTGASPSRRSARPRCRARAPTSPSTSLSARLLPRVLDVALRPHDAVRVGDGDVSAGTVTPSSPQSVSLGRPDPRGRRHAVRRGVRGRRLHAAHARRPERRRDRLRPARRRRRARELFLARHFCLSRGARLHPRVRTGSSRTPTFGSFSVDTWSFKLGIGPVR